MGWNRDLLETTENGTEATSRPIGFDVLRSESNSMLAQPHETGGTETRQRRNLSASAPNPQLTSETRTLSQQEIREARLMRLGSGGQERERRPLSELSHHSFNFKK